MQSLRRPIFIVAAVLLTLAVALEAGSTALLPSSTATGDIEALIASDDGMREAFDELSVTERRAFLDQPKPPGLAVRYLALLDGVLLFTVALMGAGMIIGERLHGRLQGAVTLVFSVLVVLGGIVLALIAVAALILMVTLLMSAPFGTIAYLALYGFFPQGAATATLAAAMGLKLAFAGCLVAAHPRFLQNRGLVLLVLTSWLGHVLIGFLHGFVPGFLVSITDAVAAIVVVVLAVVWALVFFVGSLGAVVKALRVARA